MIRKYGDIIAGGVFLVFTALYYQGTFLNLKFRLSKYGAEFVPRIYCLVMALVAIGLIVRGIVRIKKGEATAGPRVQREAAIKVVLSVILIALFTALLRPLGFVLSTVMYLALQVFITAPPEKIRPLRVVLFALVISLSLNYLFLHVFYLALPPGILTF